MSEREFIKRVAKVAILVALLILACRLTHGMASVVVAMFGAYFAMQGKTDKFLLCYLLLPFMVMLNPVLLGTGRNFYILTRLGNYLLILLPVFRWMTGGGKGRARLPIGLLFLYIVVIGLSSATGWFPLISYLKLFNFSFFLIGLYCVAGDMQSSDWSLNQVRVIFMAFAVLVICGSLALLPFPGIAYLTSARYMINHGASFEEVNAAMAAKGGMKLFTGIVNQSQALGPMSVCLTVWVLCDMLFVIRKFSKLHLVVLALAPLVIYMTRSRTAMVSFAMTIFILFFYAIGKVRMSERMKGSLKRMFYGFAVVMVLAAGVAEIKSNAMTRWLRKKDDLKGDDRGLVEAITSSRMEKIDGMMSDFYRSPLMGMGFQVTEDLPYRYKIGQASLLSASVEKGNLFVSVLSESGVVGAIVFLIFLIRFYVFCVSRRYLALMTIFTCFLATNLGEATFFSPTAMGGILWMIAAIGGFAIDLASKRRTEMEMMTGFRG